MTSVGFVFPVFSGFILVSTWTCSVKVKGICLDPFFLGHLLGSCRPSDFLALMNPWSWVEPSAATGWGEELTVQVVCSSRPQFLQVYKVGRASTNGHMYRHHDQWPTTASLGSRSHPPLPAFIPLFIQTAFPQTLLRDQEMHLVLSWGVLQKGFSNEGLITT